MKCAKPNKNGEYAVKRVGLDRERRGASSLSKADEMFRQARYEASPLRGPSVQHDEAMKADEILRSAQNDETMKADEILRFAQNDETMKSSKILRQARGAAPSQCESSAKRGESVSAADRAKKPSLFKAILVPILLIAVFAIVLLGLYDNVKLVSPTVETAKAAISENWSGHRASGDGVDSGKFKYGGGSGTYSDPWLIRSEEQLASMAYRINAGKDIGNTSFTSGCFQLANNLDLEDHYWDVPIGSSSHPFKGRFSGGGYSITGMYIDNLALESVGLFGYLSELGDGNAYCSGIGGLSIFGEIKVNESSNRFVGGLVGWMKDHVFVTNVYSHMKITVDNDYTKDGIGGVVGWSGINDSNSNKTDYTSITQCYSTGEINASGKVLKNAGGICGHTDITHYGRVAIQRCGSAMKITGGSSCDYIGGICGQMIGGQNSNWMCIDECYFAGNITCTSGVSGYDISTLAGKTDYMDSNTNLFCKTGSCKVGNTTVQYLIEPGEGPAYSSHNGTCIVSTENTKLSICDNTSYLYYNPPTILSTNGLTTATVSSPYSTTYWYFPKNGIPIPKGCPMPVGLGSGTSRYRIYNQAQANSVVGGVEMDYNANGTGLYVRFRGAYYELQNDLTLNRWWGIWELNNGAVFEGGSHTITINSFAKTNRSEWGFFRRLNTATINNLTIQYSDDRGLNNDNDSAKVGGVIGHVLGSVTLRNVSVKSAKKRLTSYGGHVGGIVGYVASGASLTMTNCSNDRFLIYGYKGGVGGLIGATNPSATSNLTNCTVSGSGMEVKSDGAWVGGLIGDADGNGTISNCSVASNVLGTYCVGGLCGWNSHNISGGSKVTSGNIKATSHGTSRSVDGAHVGGLVGLQQGGTITGSGTGTNLVSASVFAAESDSNDCTGGVVGTVTDSGTVTNIRSQAYVGSSPGSTRTYYKCQYVGGIIGYLVSGSLSGGVTHATGTVYGKDYVGGLIGYCKSNFGQDSKTYSNEAAVTGTSNCVGGLVGYMNARVAYTDNGELNVNFKNSASIVGVDYVGGLFGVVTSTIGDTNTGGTGSRNFYNTGAVQGRNKVGGIVGETRSTTCRSGTLFYNGWDGSGTRPSSATSSGSVTATGDNVAGLVGHMSAESVFFAGGWSYNFGSVTGRYCVAGISSVRRGYWTFSNTCNYGTITGTGLVGGIAAFCNQTTQCYSAYNYGSVISTGICAVDLTTTTPTFGGSGTSGAFTGGFYGCWVVGNNEISNRTTGVVMTNQGNVFSDTYHDWVGGIVGYIKASNVKDLRMTNGTTANNSLVQGLSYVGGCIGESSCPVNPSSDAPLKNYATVLGKGNYAGGIIGRANGNLSGALTNEGNVSAEATSSTLFGGIVGYATGKVGASASAINKGAVSTYNQLVGGIAGRADGAIGENGNTIKNEGNVTGTCNVGGIVGRFYSTLIGKSGKGSYSIQNTGSVTGTGSSGQYNVGGIVGGVQGGYALSLYYAENTGSVTCTSGTEGVGGICGMTKGGTIDHCRNGGYITGTKTVAGIVADVDESNQTVTNCSNENGVVGNELVAGILAYHTTANKTITITSCTNSGIVSSTGNKTGGIMAYSQTGSTINITSCSVTGFGVGSTAYDTGGILAYVNGGCTVSIKSCTYSGMGLSGGGYGLGGAIGFAGSEGNSATVTIESFTCNGGSIGASTPSTTNVGGIIGEAKGAKVTFKGTNSVTVSSFIKGITYTGGLIGHANTSGATITLQGTNTVNTAVESTNSHAGGFFGKVVIASISCSGTNTIKGSVKAPYFVGGCIGEARESASAYTLSSITNEATVTSTSKSGDNCWTGGIVGNFDNSSCTIGTVTNKGKVTGSGNLVGGIVGWTNAKLNGTLKNEGEVANGVSSRYCTGGIVGKTEGVIGSVNNASFTNTAKVTGGIYTGGIVGEANAAIASTGSAIGSDPQITVTFKNSGAISGAGGVGGICGISWSVVGPNTNQSTYGPRNFYNTGSVSGENNVGGIFGDVQNRTARGSCNLYNGWNGSGTQPTAQTSSGAVTGTGNFVGGIYGHIETTECVNSDAACYNFGTVSGVFCVGGISGTKLGQHQCNGRNYGAVSGTAIVGGIVGISVHEKFPHTMTNYASVTASGTVYVDADGSSVFYQTTSRSDLTQGTFAGGVVGICTKPMNWNSATSISNSGGAVKGGGNYVGGIVGYSYGGITMINVSNTGAVGASNNKRNYTGGIAGYTGGGIRGTNSGTVYGAQYTGGIVGYAGSAIATDGAITNSGAVTGTTYVGGVAGKINKYTGYAGSSDYHIVNKGSVTATGSYVGGIAGDSSGIKLHYCYNSGNISVTPSANISYVGGITGLCVGQSPSDSYDYAAYVNDCFNGWDGTGTQPTAAVTDKGKVTIVASGSYTVTYVGGIVGRWDTKEAELGGVTNFGPVTNNTTGERTGGIAGGSSTGWCHVNGVLRNYGSVKSSGQYVGGLVGHAQDSPMNGTSTEKRNSGTVEGTNYVGGCIGYLSSRTHDSGKYYNTGNVKGSGNNVGGVFGYIGTGRTIWDCTNGGTVEGTYNVGGIVGNTEATALKGTITNSGAVTGSSYQVGGIAGLSSTPISGTVTNSGKIAGTYNVGGLVGKTTASVAGTNANGGAVKGSSYQVGGCIGYSTVDVSGCKNANTTVYNSSGANYCVLGKVSVGGIVGYCAGNISLGSGMTNAASVCASGSDAEITIGNIKYVGAMVGGIAGYCAGTLSGSASQAEHNTGAVKATSGQTLSISSTEIKGGFVGGIVGLCGGAISNIKNSGAVGYAGNAANIPFTGGVVGYAIGQVNNTVANAGAITAGSSLYVGGIAGRAAASVSGGANSNSVAGSAAVGGVVGYASSTVTGGSSSGAVSSAGTITFNSIAASYTGGIVGYAVGNLSGTLANTGTVTGSSGFVGGVAGRASGTIGGTPSNTKAVQGTYAVGGIAGYAASTITLGTGTNSGSVTSTGSGSLTVNGSASTGGFAGGIAGYAAGTVTGNGGATNSTAANSGTVKAAAQYVGGITGYNANSINTIRNNGQVGASDSRRSYAGGISGWAQGGIANSGAVANTGAVYGAQETGGIAGRNVGAIAQGANVVNGGNVDESGGNGWAGGIAGGACNIIGSASYSATNTGNVTSAQQYTGGIVGLTLSGGGTFTFTNCSNSGTVKAAGCAGGIIGLMYQSAAITISNCTNSGKVYCTGSSGYVGGIAGSAWVNASANKTHAITGCTNSGTIGDSDNKRAYTGGILGGTGDNSRSNNAIVTLNITSTKNTGAITGANQTGGIIGGISSNAWIVNLTGVSGTTTNSGAVTGGAGTGGIGGWVKSGATFTINANVTVATGAIGGTYLVGGIVGANEGTTSISAPSNASAVTGSSITIYLRVSDGATTSTSTSGYITASCVGGIVGFTKGTLTYTANPTNSGAVKGSAGCVGGIVGYSKTAVSGGTNT
nr:hypothetical protein [Clostridia bacterium]